MVRQAKPGSIWGFSWVFGVAEIISGDDTNIVSISVFGVHQTNSLPLHVYKASMRRDTKFFVV
jgi:hypothetical protein